MENWFALYDLNSKELVSISAEVIPDAELAARNLGKLALLTNRPDMDLVSWDPATVSFKPRAADFITLFGTRAQMRNTAKTLLEVNPSTWTPAQVNQCLQLLLAGLVRDIRGGNF